MSSEVFQDVSSAEALQCAASKERTLLSDFVHCLI